MEKDLTEPYLTVNEVALMVRLSVVTIRRYTAAGKIPYHRIYRAIRYKRSEIERWVENKEAASTENQNDKNCEGKE
jgi:excisionase family DNA binding protein